MAVDVDYAAGSEDSHELPQLDTGWLDVNTTHVTIEIGGNDARFSAVLKGCILTFTACTDPSYRLTVDGVVDPEPLVTYEPKVIDLLSSNYTKILSAIRAQAPNAQIAVVGYMHIITTDINQRRIGLDCGAFDQASIDFFAQMGDRLNGVMATAASAAGASFVNPTSVFMGPPEHEACAWTTGVEWTNALIAWSNSGSGRNEPGSGSFHPKVSGRLALEPLVRAALT